MSDRREIYFSLDVESDGPIPGPNSMRQFGLAAFNLDPSLRDGGTKVAELRVTLPQMPGATPDPDTLKWWIEEAPNAWLNIHKNVASDITDAMKMAVRWVEGVAGDHSRKPVCVAYPATYDFMFLYWYMIKFVGKSPFGFQCLDMKTLAMEKLKKSFRDISKRTMPDAWFGDEKHTHDGLDDAIEQGWMFCRMMKS